MNGYRHQVVNFVRTNADIYFDNLDKERQMLVSAEKMPMVDLSADSVSILEAKKDDIKGLELSLSGYSQEEVEKYFTKLDKKHQIAMNHRRTKVMETRKKNIELLSEITRVMGIWEENGKKEMQLIELGNAELASVNDIIRQAEVTSRKIKALALKNLQEQEERLLYLQNQIKISEEVCP